MENKNNNNNNNKNSKETVFSRLYTHLPHIVIFTTSSHIVLFLDYYIMAHAFLATPPPPPHLPTYMSNDVKLNCIMYTFFVA